jgi:hypothetical protein
VWSLLLTDGGWGTRITCCQMLTGTRWLLYAADDGIVRLFDAGRCVVSQYNVPPLVPPYGCPLHHTCPRAHGRNQPIPFP